MIQLWYGWNRRTYKMKSVFKRHKRLFVNICLLILLVVLTWTSGPVAADAKSIELLEQFWASAYGPADSRTSQPFALTNDLLAKAKPDACFYGIGDPRNIYAPYDPYLLPCEEGSQAKVNQAYVWGLAKSGDELWFGTAANVLCLVEGGFLQVTNPQETDCWVCEFGETQYPAGIGDWRPPRIFVYDTQKGELTEKTDLTPPDPDSPLLNSTLGIRSAGTLDDVVILGGPSLQGGINLFAFNTGSGEFLSSTNLPDYDNIRKWLAVDGVLYTAVGNTGGEGSILRWKGSWEDPFQFEVVGELDSAGAELALHENRIFVSTWPSIAQSAQIPVPAGIWMSPVIPSGGLTADDKGNWVKVWKTTDYEPDPVTAATYGGGAMASFDGHLYWGTMHVPLVAALAHIRIYGDGEPPDPESAMMTFLGTHRAISIFRGKNFGDSPEIELVYGDPFLPRYNPPGVDPEIEPGQWEIVPNKMGTSPLYGLSGFGNFFNNYTWTMGVYKDQLFVGTMDWSFLFGTMVGPFLESYLAAIPKEILKLANYFYGADLFRFASSDSRAVPESLSGVGNYTNYGIRTMIPGENALYLGMANPMNLLTDTGDDLPEGGWELRALTGEPGPAPPPASMENHPAMVYNPGKNQFFVVFTRMEDQGIKLYGRFVRPDGTALPGEFLIDDTADYHAFPSVAFDGDSQRYLVVWTGIDPESVPLDARIYGRLIKSDGRPYDDTFEISSGILPSVAYGFEGFLVTWTDFRIVDPQTPPEINVFGQMVKPGGSLESENFPITNLDGDEPESALFPSTVYDNVENRYFVVWTGVQGNTSALFPQILNQTLNGKAIFSVLANENAGMDADIRGRFVSLDGQCSALISISSDDPGYIASYQHFPSVAYGKVDDGSGKTEGFLVAWTDVRIKDETTPMDIDVFGQILKSDGSPINKNFAISREGVYSPTAPFFPKVAPGRTKIDGEGFLTVWPDISNTLSPESRQVNLADIYGQFVKSDGACTGDNFIISDAALLQWFPGVAYNSDSTDFLTAFSRTNAVTYTTDIAFSLVGSQKTSYVDIQNGNDTNDGSLLSPWKTLHHAISRINGGGSGTYALHVALGTYSVANGEADSGLTLTQNDVTIIGASGSAPLLNGTGATNWTKGFIIESSNSTIRNLYITGFSDYDEMGIQFNSGSDNAVENCKTYGNYEGINIGSTTSGNTIRGCESYQNGKGILCYSSNNVITQNTIHDNTNDGVYVRDSSPEVSRNEVYDNQYGISVDGSDSATASPTIKNNLIYEATLDDVSYGITIGGNGTSTVNPKVYHNTIDGGIYEGVIVEKYENSSINPEIKYNIITNFRQYGIQNSGGNPTIDYNDVWNNGSSASDSYKDCTAGLNDISEDPLYGSYELQSTSPCIDKIPPASDPVTIDYPGYSRPKGTDKDMGAYEYVGSVEYPSTLPGGTGLVTDYRIFTVPLDMGTGADLQSTMEATLVPYDPAIWRVFGYYGGQYYEMDTPAFSSLKVVPGMAFWIITFSKSIIPFEGGISPDGVNYQLELPPDWSLIALPWTDTNINLRNIAVTDGVNTYPITSAANTLTQRCVWDYTGSGPYSGYEKRNLTTYPLKCGTGYFVKVLAGANIKLIIPPDNAAVPTMLDGDSRGVSSTGGDEEEPPLPPGGSYEPVPDIHANEAGGTVTVSPGSPVSIKIGLNPGDQIGVYADWWIAAYTPFGWYSYVHNLQSWQSGIHAAVQAPLFELTPPFEVLNASLPPGGYTFYFAVDGNMDGKADATWYDSVEVDVRR